MLGFLRKFLALFRGKTQIFASIGDVCSKRLLEGGVEPHLIIVDNRTGRKSCEPFKVPRRYQSVRLHFRGILSKRDLELLAGLGSGVRHTVIFVDGEDDGMLYPVMAIAPLGGVIVAGRERFIVDEDSKRKASFLVKKPARCFYLGGRL